MADATKAKEVLLGLGLSTEQVEGIVAGIGSQRTAAESSGIRQKSFDLGAAQEMITSLETQIKTLTEQLGAIELAHTAAKALDSVDDARTPKQETYTLESLQETMVKAFQEAVKPFVEKQHEETQALVALMNRVNDLGTVAKTAQDKVTELTGELPRALRVPAVSRYADAVGVNGDRPAISQKEESDVFGWVDDYLQGL